MLATVFHLPVGNVHNDFETFFSEELKSDNTRRAYRKDIVRFYSIMKHKNINELVYTGKKDKTCDLWFEYKDILKYRNHLRDVLGKNSSINRSITSLRKLYKYLAKNNYNINPHAFELDELDIDDLESSGVLTPEEAMEMIERAKVYRNGEEKSVFLELAWNTSIRVSALLNATWKNINKLNNGQWEIAVKDKTKMNKQGVPSDLYEKLMTLKQNNNEKIFSFSYTTIHELVKQLSQEMNIPEERNISPHSFRKSLIDYTVKVLKDPVLAAKQGNHTLEVMHKHYLSENADYSNRPAFILREENDVEKLAELSKEQLLNLIQKASLNTQVELLRLMKQEG